MSGIFKSTFLFAESEIHWLGLAHYGWLSFLLISLAGFFIWKLLRDEQQLVSRPVGWSLLTLRCSILLLLLLTLWQPTLINTIDKTRLGKVLIAIDESDSMHTQDSHATLTEQLRWARALRWVTPDTKLELVPQDPENENVQPNTQQQQAAHSENLKETFAKVSNLTRQELLTTVLQKNDVQLHQPLADSHLLEYVSFAGDVGAIRSNAIRPNRVSPNLVHQDKKEHDENDTIPAVPDLQPTHTNLNSVLRKTIQQSGSHPMSGLVLFTDGQHNSSSLPAEVIPHLTQLKIPVFPVIVGSEITPSDILIESIDASPAVYLEDNSEVTVNLRVHELPNQEVEVQLLHQGNLIERSTFQTSKEHNSTKTISFPLRTQAADQQHYEIIVTALPNEISIENNHLHFTQQVLDNTIKALLIEKHPRWEFRFLHNALKRDKRINLTTILLHPPELTAKVNETRSPFQKTVDLPQKYADSLFAEQDFIILGDITSADFPKHSNTFWKHLEQFVSDEGKTLLFLPGPQLIANWKTETIASQLAPINQPTQLKLNSAQADVLSQGSQVFPTAVGLGTPFLQLAPLPEQNQLIWNQLPPQVTLFSGESKPAAEVLLEAIRAPHEKPSPILVTHQYGEGQVVWIGLDGTWRWRRRVGDKYHHRFWGQLARWATQNQLSVQTDLVRFGPERSEGRPSQPIRLHAHFSSKLKDRLPKLAPQVAIYKLPHQSEEKPLQTIPLLPLPSRPQSMTAEIDSLDEGEYELFLEVQDESIFPEPVFAPLIVRPDPSLEQTQTIANRELLSQLAESTGGKLFELDQLSQIPAAIKQPTTSEIVNNDSKLWTHPIWLVLFFLLLSIEWLLRKWNGLP